MSTSFKSLRLRPELLAALDQLSFTRMTPIQAKALPAMLKGRDVTGQAKTGSGKTAAFGLALLDAINVEMVATQALVICPTRELAEQVAQELRSLASQLPNTQVLTVCGGQPSHEQRRGLRRGAQVVVGTPGRLNKHLRQGSLHTHKLRLLVLDEADRMLDMGFIDQVLDLEQSCPRNRQTLLFSATFPVEIRQLSQDLQRDPLHVKSETQVAPDMLQQFVYQAEPRRRHQLVADLLAHHKPSTALLFCETRAGCDKLATFLSNRGATALALHGQMEQRDRDDVLTRFSNGSASVLVATNVAARGIDIPELPMVIVVELSPDPEIHVHRIGRTGRAGVAGLALSVVGSDRERGRLESIEEFIGHSIEPGEAPPEGGDLSFLTPPMRTLLLFAGKKDKLRKGDVLGALVKDAGLPFEAIGKLELGPRTCAVAVTHEYAQQALDFLSTGRVKKMRVRGRLLG